MHIVSFLVIQIVNTSTMELLTSKHHITRHEANTHADRDTHQKRMKMRNDAAVEEAFPEQFYNFLQFYIYVLLVLTTPNNNKRKKILNEKLSTAFLFFFLYFTVVVVAPKPECLWCAWLFYFAKCKRIYCVYLYNRAHNSSI